jgi:head-tail adaptor
MALSSAELAQIRVDIGGLLPDTGYILSLSQTTDDAGGLVDTWGTAGTADCRVDYKAGKQMMTGGAVVPYQKATISMDYDETITTANRVKVGDYTFSIEAVNVGQSWIGTKRITAEVLP